MNLNRNIKSRVKKLLKRLRRLLNKSLDSKLKFPKLTISSNYNSIFSESQNAGPNIGNKYCIHTQKQK